MDGFSGAIKDIVEGLRLTPLWGRLGWEQTMSRFRRTILGPFWLSANLLAISFALAVVFGGLMGTDYKTNFALIISGILTWSIIGTPIGESAGVFIGSAGYLHSIKLPLSFHVFLMMHRTLINFLAQLVALWVVLLIMQLGAFPSWQILFAVPIVLINSTLISLIIGIPSARFRDVNQLVAPVVQILFFTTPVFWAAESMKGKRRIIVDDNPFAHMLELVRQPLLGRAPALSHWIWSLGTMAVLAALAIILLSLYRKRVVFWV